MLDDKKIEESSKVIKQLIQEGIITKPEPEVASFFLNKSQETLIVAERLKRVEEYVQAVNEAEELLQLGEKKIKSLVEDFDSELSKRKIFTYEMLDDTQENKAKTSLERAKMFLREIEKIVNKK
ncbi:MAG: hypothetical protein AABX39_04980 [Nanoarchaeota archaeon]